MSEVQAYKPSWKNIGKYNTYISYFIEYLKNNDFKSLSASLKYVLTHKLPLADYEAHSKLGKFLIRKNTTDFQFINYAYERSIKDYLSKNIDSFDVFIDLGACIGEYCIWLAKEGKKCIAVEPVNWKALTDNIALNNLENKIVVFPCGVGSKKERVFFNILTDVTSSSHVDKKSINEPNVDIDTVDNIIKKANLSAVARIIMKIDVEGMEEEVISGARNLISSTQNLRIIYEHFQEDGNKNDNALLSICAFEIRQLDSVNKIATKK